MRDRIGLPLAVAAAIAATWLPGCRRSPSSSSSSAAAAAMDGRGTPLARDGSAAEDEALALMPLRGEGAGERAVRRRQDDVRKTPGSAAAWVALGRAWIQQARAASDPALHLNAGAAASRALALDPRAAAALAIRGAVELDAHRFDDARRTAEAALAIAPEDLVALGVLADALVELGRYEAADAAAARMMALKPSLPAYARASWLRWLRGDTGPALEAIRRGIDAAPAGEPRAWALVQAAQVFLQRGDAAGAEAGYALALEVHPGYPPALVGQGRAALARGDAKGAVAALDEAFRRAPHAETAWLLGEARRAAGDRAGADRADADVDRLGRAAEPRVLALFLATRGASPGEAVRLAEEERARRPDVYSDDALAWALHRAGRAGDAWAAADRALRLGTPDARLLFHAGAIRLAGGDANGGRALLRRALAGGAALFPAEREEAERLVGGGAKKAAASTPRPLRGRYAQGERG
jgi:tetratricopeptide (TPR) repeat protein